MTARGLLDAVSVLEAQGAGCAPDRAHVLAGELAWDSLCRQGVADRDILDAATGLKLLATSHELELDKNGCARAARLAEAVRKAANVEITRQNTR